MNNDINSIRRNQYRAYQIASGLSVAAFRTAVYAHAEYYYGSKNLVPSLWVEAAGQVSRALASR